MYDLTEDEVVLEKNKKHTIEAVVDRLIVKADIHGRLADSLETALKLAEGVVVVNVIDGEDILFSEKFACIDCGISVEDLSPRTFSFNSPFGKCDRCDGLGTLLEIDENLVIPDRSKSINGGAFAHWSSGRLKEDSWSYSVMTALSKKYNFSLDTPINELSDEVVDILLYGTQGEKVLVHYDKEFSSGQFYHNYEGEVNILKEGIWRQILTLLSLKLNSL